MLKKAFTHLPRLAALLLGAVAATSCVSKVPVSQSFWQDRQAKVAVAVTTGSGKGAFYKEGNQGLLDIAINSAMTTGPNRALANLSPEPFRQIKGQFVTELKKRGINAVAVPADLKFSDYPKLKGGSSGDAGRDYSPVFTAYQADYLVVLSLNAYGSIRPYYGFMPTGRPSGYAHATGFMIKRGSAQPSWNTGVGYDNRNVVPVEGEWDQGPEFKHLTEASRRAVDNSRSYLIGNFFH
ncbi:MAG: hypothetical protein QM755_20930 [Luteolibacter sp.]